MDNIEIHVKEYGITKSKDVKKNGKCIGLETRLIITPPKGAKKILNFDFHFEAKNYIKDNYGDITNINRTYNICNNWNLYGKKGYRWK